MTPKILMNNTTNLKDLAPQDQFVLINVDDCSVDKHTTQFKLPMPRNKVIGHLLTDPHLAVGAKVMLIADVTIDGLLDSVRGTVDTSIKALL